MNADASEELKGRSDRVELRGFMKRLLDDVWALETMLRDGVVEAGITRLGAEQELVLVRDAYRPAPVSLAVLEELNDPKFTTELAQFGFHRRVNHIGGICRHVGLQPLQFFDQLQADHVGTRAKQLAQFDKSWSQIG